MQRKEFLKSCSMGVCSCFAINALIPRSTNAQEQTETENPEVKKLKGQIEFVHKRFATLMGLLNEEMDADKRMKMFEELGKVCSSEYKDTYMKFENDVDGFLNEINGKWVEDIKYDKENQTILLTGMKTEDCFCPLATKSVTPAEFCDCSKGWQKGTFEAISKKKVEVSIVESKLRGGDRCSFKIQMS
jgi:predicted hydrocarbon binding protein